MASITEAVCRLRRATPASGAIPATTAAVPRPARTKRENAARS